MANVSLDDFFFVLESWSYTELVKPSEMKWPPEAFNRYSKHKKHDAFDRALQTPKVFIKKV